MDATIYLTSLLSSKEFCLSDKQGSTYLFDQVHAYLKSVSSKHIHKKFEKEKIISEVWNDFLLWMDGKHSKTNRNLDDEKIFLNLNSLRMWMIEPLGVITITDVWSMKGMVDLHILTTRRKYFSYRRLLILPMSH